MNSDTFTKLFTGETMIVNHRLEMCWHKIYNNGDNEAKYLSSSELQNANSTLVSWGWAIFKGFNMENMALTVKGKTNVIIPITGIVG